MNGVEALRAIREERPELPVILMTAYSTRELLAEADQLGALRIFPKPLPLADLLALLDRAALSGERVLLVDDDPNFLRTLGGILGEHGHTVLAASNLADALALLRRAEPAVVVLDLKLDHVAPREAVRAVHEAAKGSAALVLCSGYPALMEDTVAGCPTGWFHATLAKPFPPENLLALLERLSSAS
jgi:DNA-binding NtrC family response regulator